MSVLSSAAGGTKRRRLDDDDLDDDDTSGEVTILNWAKAGENKYKPPSITFPAINDRGSKDFHIVGSFSCHYSSALPNAITTPSNRSAFELSYQVVDFDTLELKSKEGVSEWNYFSNEKAIKYYSSPDRAGVLSKFVLIGIYCFSAPPQFNFILKVIVPMRLVKVNFYSSDFEKNHWCVNFLKSMSTALRRFGVDPRDFTMSEKFTDNGKLKDIRF